MVLLRDTSCVQNACESLGRSEISGNSACMYKSSYTSRTATWIQDTVFSVATASQKDFIWEYFFGIYCIMCEINIWIKKLIILKHILHIHEYEEMEQDK